MKRLIFHAVVFVDEGIIKAEFLGDGLRGDLAFAIDEELRSHAWMTVHVFTGIGSKVAGQVGETLLEWVHVAYFCLRAAKNLHDAVEDVSIDVLYEVGVDARSSSRESNSLMASVGYPRMVMENSLIWSI